MQSLSTELDEMILGYLDPLALSALSMTSKYYRRIAEPHLYKNLVFYVEDAYGVFNLLFNLVNRQELAQHIQSFTLLDDPDYHDKQIRGVGEAFHWTLRKFGKKISRLIEDLCVDESFAFALRWQRAIVHDGTYLYGALALILCLAHNLQHLNNLNDSHYIISHILRKRWTHFDNQENRGYNNQTQTALAKRASKNIASERQAVHDRDKAKLRSNHTADRIESSPKDTARQDKAEEEYRPFPFGKLKTLSVSGHGPNIPLLPWLETIKIDSIKGNACLDMFYLPYQADNLDTQLQTLNISGLRTSPKWYLDVLEAPKFRKLKQLRIRGIAWFYGWGKDAVQAFVDHLATRLPSLESFEFYDHDSLSWIDAPLNFQSLPNLRTLKVDLRLLAPKREDVLVYLRKSLTGFPACLETLILTKIWQGELGQFIVESNQPVDATNFVDAVSITALKKVEMYVQFSYDSCEDPDETPTVLEEGVERYLRSLISSLAGVGIEMQVWCQKHTHKVRLLNGPQG
jgi:hypothetical protein